MEGAAAFQAAFLMEGRDLKSVIDKVREKVPGFTEEQYRAAVGRGFATAIRRRREQRRYREEFAARARAEPLFHAVFMLRHFTDRPLGSPDRLGPFNVYEVLGDLHPPKAIEEAIAAADGLLEAGRRCDLSETDAVQRLSREHPGFIKRDYIEAVEYGWFLSR
ncbi:hypothetical protein [Brevibacterium daeguense]|uniref:hypothetical protein n=1 Tax=Brevibacterium daeguense TaxID=909936 RepID=UPI001F476AF6|nr:hypothetical protein [Brevibacterium daeguense]